MSGAAKGGASWSNDEKSASSKFNDTNYMHVVYEVRSQIKSLRSSPDCLIVPPRGVGS